MRRGAGCLLGLLGVLAGLLVVGGGADIGARHYATSRIEQRISTDVPSARGVHGHILGWPFLRVVANGRISEMGARIAAVQVGRVTFTDFDVEIHNLRVSTSGLLTGGHVTVESIGYGTVTAILPFSQFGVPSLPVGGVSVTVDAVSRTLVIGGARLSVATTIVLPSADLMPCLPKVTLTTTEATLGCRFTHVPAAFTS